MSFRVPALLLILFLLGTLPVRAVSIVAPTPGQRLAAAPDYATDVLGNPWDMEDRDDYSLFEPGENSGFSSLGLDGQGRLIGTVASSDASIGILYRGFYGAVNPGINGRRFPIDSTKYSKLAFKLVSTVAGELPQVYWYHYPHSQPMHTDSFGVQLIASSSAVGAKIYVVDLTAGDDGSGNGWMAGPVLGLRIDPNSTAASIGQQMGLDWVRLVPGDGNPLAPALTVQWSGSGGGYSVSVQELGANAAAPLTIASGATGGSFMWRYGFLPPGDYRLTVSRDGAGPPDTSSVDFSINAPPVLRFTEPDETGGEDFATTVLANPWDMSDPADVVRVDNMTGPGTFADGQFTDTSVKGEVGRDSQVWLLFNDTAATPRIDPARYHRLTYRYTLDGPADFGDGGSVARLLWGATFNHADRLAMSEDVVVWAGPHSYTIDLATLDLGEDRGIEPSAAQEVWAAGAKRYFRFDPHEGAAGRTFHIDDVRIAADDQPAADGTFTIRWQSSDPDSQSPPRVNLYFDTDTDPNNGKTPIVAGLDATAGQYVWNTSSMPAGVYQVYAEITDGINTTARYATGPVRVGGFPEICGDCIDNDGNGLVDDEDPACCAEPAKLHLTRARFRPNRGGGLGLTQGLLNVAASVDDPAFAAENFAAEDVTLQFRNASGELLCGTAEAGRVARRKRKFVFDDPSGLRLGGIRKMTFRARNGAVELGASGQLIDLRRYFSSGRARNDFDLTVRVGGRCAQGTAMLRGLPKGRFGYP